jgi:hypothetical protein
VVFAEDFLLRVVLLVVVFAEDFLLRVLLVVVFAEDFLLVEEDFLFAAIVNSTISLLFNS